MTPKRDSNVTQRIYNYLMRRPGVVIYSNDVANELGLNLGSVASSMQRMQANTRYNVHRVARGSYIYHPNGIVPASVEDEPRGATIPEPRPIATSKQAVSNMYGKVEAGQEIDIVSTYPLEFTDEEFRQLIPDHKYEYVGNMGKHAVIRDTESKLYLAMPLDTMATELGLDKL